MSQAPLVRLGDCCEIVSGATPSTSVEKYWGGDIAWATPKDLSDLDSKYLAATPSTLTEEGYQSCSAKIMPAGSVLFSSRAPIGHVAISSIPMCTNQGFKSLVPDSKRVSADYLYHWLRANKTYLQSLGNGATFKEVSKATVSEVKVPLPPLDEQRRIAAILDKADTLRGKRREAIAKLDLLLKCIFLDMFGGMVGANLRSLGSLAAPQRNSFTNGPFGSDLLSSELVDSGVPVIYIRDIRNGTYARISTVYVTIEKAEKIRACNVLPGDLLISKVGSPPGVAAVYPAGAPPAVITQDVIRLRINPELVTAEYLQGLLNSDIGRALLQPIVVEATRARFSLSDLKAVEVPVPALSAQRNFSEIVARVERQVRLLSQHEERADEMFMAIQSRAFSGGI